MAQTVKWDGHIWEVTKGAHVWTFSRDGGRRRMAPYTEQVPVQEAATVEEAVAWLDARALAKLAADRQSFLSRQAAEASETLAGQQAEEAGYQQTKAIIGALERGMPMEQIEAALEGRPYRPGRTVQRCRKCGTSGYAGEYPFSTGYAGLCDDCGG